MILEMLLEILQIKHSNAGIHCQFSIELALGNQN